MTIDIKAILARADEAMDLLEKTSQQGPRRVDPCALIPQLAADVRELVAEVERLSLVADQAVSAIEGVCETKQKDMTAFHVEQQTKLAEAEAKIARDELKLSNVHANLRAVAQERDEALVWLDRCIGLTERAEKAEARVKELEARHISDCEHAKIIQGANEKLSSRINELGDWFHEQVARAELAESRLAIAVEALKYIADIRGQIIASSDHIARAALAKIGEGKA